MNIDRNTIIGLVLMAAVLFGFMWYENTSRQKRALQQQKEQTVEAIAQSAAEASAANAADSLSAAEPTAEDTPADSASALFAAHQPNEGTTQIENQLLRLTVSNKGGALVRAELKDPTYKNQQGGQVVLFEPDDIDLHFMVDGKDENINTADLYFTPTATTADAVTMTLPVATGSIDIQYRLLPDSYILAMDISAKGLAGFFPTKTNTIDIQWSERMLQQEKGFDFENRYSTITYRTTDDDTDELSSAGADKTKDKFGDGEQMQWIAFKTQFFSQVLIADSHFTPATMVSKQYKRDDPSREGHLKTYDAQFSTPFDPTGHKPTQLKMYLGPNKFSTLRENERLCQTDRNLDLQSLVYLGWPLIKYINRFVMLYIFDFMTSLGINMGIVLLLITIILKIAVYPLQRKSYLSSARMRVLKPKIEEVTKKYPGQDQAMQRQQETMKIYSEYGVSPMGGCLPMLIQMPIWIAMFNFVPAAIELRGQSFLWANDLSAYDDVIHWDTWIWGIGNHLSLFCVLWSLSTIANTWLSMRQQQDSMSPEQAQQMKMMQWMSYLMPLIFFFTFNDYSSGLNYYYFVSGLISILTMWYLRRSTDDKKLLAQLEQRYQQRKAAGSGVQKTSSMMGRLQAMAEKQQEMMRKQQEAQNRKK